MQEVLKLYYKVRNKLTAVGVYRLTACKGVGKRMGAKTKKIKNRFSIIRIF